MLVAQPPYAHGSRPPSRSSHGGPPRPLLLSRGERIRRGTKPPAYYLADCGASGTLAHERQGGAFDLRVERRAPSAHRLLEGTGTVASGRHLGF